MHQTHSVLYVPLYNASQFRYFAVIYNYMAVMPLYTHIILRIHLSLLLPHSKHQPKPPINLWAMRKKSKHTKSYTEVTKKWRKTQILYSRIEMKSTEYHHVFANIFTVFQMNIETVKRSNAMQCCSMFYLKKNFEQKHAVNLMYNIGFFFKVNFDRYKFVGTPLNARCDTMATMKTSFIFSVDEHTV